MEDQRKIVPVLMSVLSSLAIALSLTGQMCFGAKQVLQVLQVSVCPELYLVGESVLIWRKGVLPPPTRVTLPCHRVSHPPPPRVTLPCQASVPSPYPPSQVCSFSCKRFTGCFSCLPLYDLVQNTRKICGRTGSTEVPSTRMRFHVPSTRKR